MRTIRYHTTSVAALIAGVTAGDSASENGLLEMLTPGTRLLLRRRVNSGDIEDAIQEVLLSTLEAIRQDRLRQPMALPGYVRTITIRVAARITATYTQRRQEADACDQIDLTDTPEHRLLRNEQREIVRLVLGQLNAQEREILERSYLLEQTKEQIRSDMGVTEAQIRLAKDRAKRRLTARIPGMRSTKSPIMTSWQCSRSYVA